MARVQKPTDDALFELLRRLDGRMAAIERRNKATFRYVPPAPAMLSADTSGSYTNEESEVSNHLLAVGASRLAFLVDHQVNDASADARLRCVAMNADRPFPAQSPVSIVPEFSFSNTFFDFTGGNVALPDAVRNGQMWNFQWQARMANPNGVREWTARPWAMIVTDDPDFVPSTGG